MGQKKYLLGKYLHAHKEKRENKEYLQPISYLVALDNKLEIW